MSVSSKIYTNFSGRLSHHIWVCREKSMFAGLSTQCFPSLKTCVTKKEDLELQRYEQFCQRFLNCQGTILLDLKAKVTNTESVFNQRWLHYLFWWPLSLQIYGLSFIWFIYIWIFKLQIYDFFFLMASQSSNIWSFIYVLI